MASTNKTTNYDLSQYIGTDKPTYLSDYNGDMYKIDAQMKTNADNIATAISSASTATSTANSANSTAQSALNTAETASSTASSANTTANNAQSTANSALATATTANANVTELSNTVDSLEADILKFNLVNFKTYATNEFTVNGSGSITYSTLTLATNSDGSIFKLYGQFNYTGSINTVSINTTLRPENNYNINCAGIDSGMYPRTIEIATTGVITLPCYGADRSNFYWPCLYFNKDFGDEPEV